MFHVGLYLFFKIYIILNLIIPYVQRVSGYMPKCDIEIQKKWDNICIGFIDKCSNQSSPNTQLALADGRQSHLDTTSCSYSEKVKCHDFSLITGPIPCPQKCQLFLHARDLDKNNRLNCESLSSWIYNSIIEHHHQPLYFRFIHILES